MERSPVGGLARQNERRSLNMSRFVNRERKKVDNKGHDISAFNRGHGFVGGDTRGSCVGVSRPQHHLALLLES